jgi:hypothetical protein
MVCFASLVLASDIQKGEAYYTFLLQDSLKYEAKDFAKQYSIKEWEELFKDEAYYLKQVLLKQNFALSKTIKGKKFNESLMFLKAYMKAHAKDARVFPTCE